MSTEPFDEMPKIRLDKDDVESFQRTRAQSNKKPSQDKHTADEPTSSANSPSWFAFLFLLLVIIGGAAYWSFEQHKVLIQAQNRITELENRLSATGEDMGQSAAALQVKVSELSNKTAELWEQMDKLWASAWRRNQADIAALDKTLTTVKANNKNATDNLSGELSDNATALGLVKEQLENQASLLKQINTRVNETLTSGTDIEQQLGSLREKLISTALANNNLTNQIEDLAKRVLASENKVKELSKPAVINP